MPITLNAVNAIVNIAETPSAYNLPWQGNIHSRFVPPVQQLPGVFLLFPRYKADDSDNNFAVNSCRCKSPIGRKGCRKLSAKKVPNAPDVLPVFFLFYPIFSVGYSRPNKEGNETGASTA
jgi:hypothetical protein